ncbi:hypothetical protein BKA82DRAFT_23344 [Pisolithus tinctorius]|uniref:Uncharacterized protein n=1 Tax=Pisolithus tinctorius Marx 270 TaxID=870435 RepID=A0A0C3PIX5_PISTI|nr:hypothetical protein BKA82DRAFT_23344 [Pisolithus tinctorius]KIO08074.1 hypothetical protein M404DRAFT_23344 [Pisolithus tinctorius Marx 270]
MSSNPNNSPPNVSVLADDLTHATSILQLLLGLSQGDTESRNVLLACLGSLMGLSPPLPASQPQAVVFPVQPVNTPPVDVVQDEPAPTTTTALGGHTPAEPTPVAVVIQELNPGPALDLPTFDMLPDALASMSTSTSTVTLSHTPSPSLLGPLDPPSPLTPTISPNCLASVPDIAMPADPIPTCQALDTSEPGLDHLPADSPLTGHMSLNHPLSPTPSLTPPPSTSDASSSNSVPTLLTSSSPSSLPLLSNAKMLVMLHEALHATIEVLDQALKGHAASKKALGKRKLHD